MVAESPNVTGLTPTSDGVNLGDLNAGEQVNHILYQLAKQLGYAPLNAGDVEAVRNTIVADPDEVLERALDIIWRYQDMADS